jgi:hypothetical protein
VDGSTVVIVTHEIEPFVGSAETAVSVRAGPVRLHHPLPADPIAKAALLDALTRGILADVANSTQRTPRN